MHSFAETASDHLLAEHRQCPLHTAMQSDNYGGRWATIMMAGEGVAE